MDAREKEIEALTAELAGLDARIRGELEAVGRKLPPAPEAAAALAGIERLRADIGRILELDRKRDALFGQIDETDLELIRLNREIDALCESIGRVAYETFLGMTENAPYRDLFAPVLRLDAEIGRHEDEIEVIEREERTHSFLRKLIRDKGRKVVARGSIKRIEKTKGAAFAEAGRRVVASSFVDRVRAGCGRELADLEARRGMLDKRLHEKSGAASGAGDIDRELASLRALPKPRDRARDLEGEIEEAAARLRALHVAAGREYLKRRPEESPGLSELLAEADAKRRRIDVLRAESEMQQIADRETQLTERRRVLEEAARVTERQIHVIDIEITVGRRRLDQIKKVLSDGAPYAEPPPLPPSPDFYAGRDRTG